MHDSCGISVILGLRGTTSTAGITKRAVGMTAPHSLGPLLGAFSCLRYQADALSNRLGRFGLMYVSRFGTEGLTAEPFTCRQINSGAVVSITPRVMKRQLGETRAPFTLPGKLVLEELKKCTAHCMAYKQKPK